jgi:hypothetical protein
MRTGIYTDLISCLFSLFDELQSVPDLAPDIRVIQELNPDRVPALSPEQQHAAITIVKHPQFNGILQKMKFKIRDSAE